MYATNSIMISHNMQYGNVTKVFHYFNKYNS